jgi:hypothetical protein
MSVTIIVDTSRLEEEQRFTTKRKSWRRGRKRKVQEVTDDSNEVPDSQDAVPEREGMRCLCPKAMITQLTSIASMSPQKKSPSTKGTPSKKRQRTGFTTRSSQIGFQSEESFGSSQDVSQPEPDLMDDSEIPQDHSFVSVDIEAQKDKEGVVDPVSSPTPQPPRPDNIEAIEISSEPAIPEVELPKIPQATNKIHVDEMVMEAPEAAKNSNAPNVEIIKETTIDNSMAKKSSSAPAKSEIDPHEEAMPDAPPEIGESESSTAAADQNREVAVQEQPGFSARLIESIKGRLRSVVGDLGLLGLGRRETLEIEDLFMDGKRALYQAESRGRESEGR